MNWASQQLMKYAPAKNLILHTQKILLFKLFNKNDQVKIIEEYSSHFHHSERTVHDRNRPYMRLPFVLFKVGARDGGGYTGFGPRGPRFPL